MPLFVCLHVHRHNTTPLGCVDKKEKKRSYCETLNFGRRRVLSQTIQKQNLVCYSKCRNLRQEEYETAHFYFCI